jgi:hypothetical protein
VPGFTRASAGQHDICRYVEERHVQYDLCMYGLTMHCGEGPVATESGLTHISLRSLWQFNQSKGNSHLQYSHRNTLHSRLLL